MKIRTSPHFACLALALASAQLSSAAIIVSESFGGGTGALNGTFADTFDAAITTAGGSSTWAAVSAFDANGTVTGNSSTSVTGSAYLNLGSYINDHKGAADGKFIATATIDAAGLTSWYGVSFFAGNSVTLGNTFQELNIKSASS